MEKSLFIKVLFVSGIVIIIAGLGTWWQLGWEAQKLITNFDECIAAGNPVMESYPRQCRTKDGQTFEEKISFGNKVTAKISQTVYSHGLSITPLQVTEDSRCPVDVVCLWAGTLTVAVSISSDDKTVGKNITLGKEEFFGDIGLTLEKVSPAPRSKFTISQADYVFEFLVAPRTGIIQGKVDVGPICPVEQEGAPCSVPPEAYTSRQIIVYRADGNTEVARSAINPDGTYVFLLPLGAYVLDMVRRGIDTSSDLPHPFTVSSGSSLEFNFLIDTGIR